MNHSSVRHNPQEVVSSTDLTPLQSQLYIRIDKSSPVNQMNANGSNPNTNNQPQLSNAYAQQQQQPPPNAVVEQQQQLLQQQIDPQQQTQQYYPARSSHHPATLVLPQDTVIQMTRQGNGHQFVQATFQRPEQATGYPPVNYSAAVNPYYQGQYAYPQVFPNNMAAQQQFLAQQAVVQNFHQQQQQQQHHPQHQQHYSQQQQQPPTQVPMSQQQQQQQPIAVVAPQQQTILNPPMPQKPKRVLTIVDPSTNTVINDEQVRETVQAASKSNASAAASVGEESTAAATTAAAIQNNFSKLVALAYGEDKKAKPESGSSTPAGQEIQGADTNSTTTTTTTTTVEATPGGGAHTESTKSKEAATDENEPILSGAAQLRSSSIGVVQQQQQKTQQLIRSGSAPKEVDSADIQALTTAFKEKLHTQSPQATPSPPFTAASSAQAHSSSVSREGSRGPIVITADVIKEEHYGKSDRHSVENGGTSSPSIVVSGDHRGSLQDSSQYSFQKHRSPSHEIGGEEAYTENGKHGGDSPLENGLSEPLAETEGETGPEATLKKCEDQMTEFLKNPEEAQKISSEVYSSNFLHLMRTFIRELRHVRCPKTEAELQEMGIDLAGMPANAISTKVGMRHFPINSRPGDSPFIPSWQTGGTGGTLNPRMSGGNRPPPYVGRGSEGRGGGARNKTFTGRNSMQPNKRPNQPALPERGDNAWKPKKETKESKDEDEARHDNVKKEVRGLLNKITPSTYEAMVQQFCDYKVHTDPKLLPMIITLIFEKAVEEPRFCPLYSDLCLKQVELENKIVLEERPPTSFRSSIITKCQETFLGATSSDDLIKQLEEERASEETEDSKKIAITEKIDLLKSKEKRRLLGIIKFIAQLYRHNLLIDMIINWCVVELIKRYDKTKDDVYIEYAVQMIETVGPTFDKKRLLAQKQETAATPTTAAAAADAEVPPIEKIVAHLSSIKASLTNRVKFMIMNLEDLRKNNWQAKHGNTGPKTLGQVKLEAEQEQLENEQERAAYDRKKALTSDFGNKKGGRSNYPGRGSIENNNSRPAPQSTDRRAAAAQASNQIGTASVRKDTNLNKVDDGRLGSRRPNVWAAKSNTNASFSAVAAASVTPPPGSESTPKETSPPQ